MSPATVLDRVVLLRSHGRTFRRTWWLARNLRCILVAPIQKMTEDPGVVACACNKHPISPTAVPISANIKMQNIEAVKAEEEKEMQTTAEKNSKKSNMTPPDKPYQDILAFHETGKISLFKSENYKVSVSIGTNSSGNPPCRFCIWHWHRYEPYRIWY